MDTLTLNTTKLKFKRERISNLNRKIKVNESGEILGVVQAPSADGMTCCGVSYCMSCVPEWTAKCISPD